MPRAGKALQRGAMSGELSSQMAAPSRHCPRQFTPPGPGQWHRLSTTQVDHDGLEWEDLWFSADRGVVVARRLRWDPPGWRLPGAWVEVDRVTTAVRYPKRSTVHLEGAA